MSEPESLAFVGAAGIAVTEVVAVPDAAAAVRAARTIGRPVALKLDAVGLAHKSDIGGVALGLRGDDAVYGAALTLLEIGRRRGLTVRGLLVEADGATRCRAHPRPAARSAVRAGGPGRAGRRPDRGARRRRGPAGADRPAETADAMLDDLRGSRILGAVRGRPPSIGRRWSRMLVALGRLGMRAPRRARGGPQPGDRVGRRGDRGRRAGRAGRPARCRLTTEAVRLRKPVLLRRATPWGVRLTLNRPAKLNALSGELVGALVAAIDAAAADAGGPGHRPRGRRVGRSRRATT